MWTRVVCLLWVVGVALAQSESIIINVEQGPVRGYLDPQGGLYSFLNIPYATAPTGVNKYKAPLPPPTWTEPFELTNKLIICPQEPSELAALVTMQEDCLITNIFIPVTNATNLPVFVSVHGGAYQVGASAIVEFNSLVRTQKVIVVTMNYRLGVQGFLCLGTKDIPGNAGMKDQVALLRWVQRNIARFGGNPDDVTISGCSAGGGSIDFLTISPMTDGLFKKAIPESGAVLGCVGAQLDPIENAKLYAKQLNFTNVDDLSALEDFYKTASYELLWSEANFITERDDTLFLFSPCVERDTGEERFLDDTPVNILNNGKYHRIPLLSGYAQMEGLFRVPVFDEYKSRMNEKFSNFLPAELQFENEIQKDEVAARVKEFYFGNQNVSEQTILAYVDYFTDIMFAYPMLRVANLRRASMNDTIYLYEYSFVDENTPIVPHTTVRGPNHCEQSMAVADDIRFGIAPNHTEQFIVMRQNMRELWLNFIISGNPTPESSSLPSWSPVSGVVSPFMNLNATIELEQSSLLGARFQFWDSIYKEHYKAPVPPSVPGSGSASTTSFIFLTAALVVRYVIV